MSSTMPYVSVIGFVNGALKKTSRHYLLLENSLLTILHKSSVERFEERSLYLFQLREMLNLRMSICVFLFGRLSLQGLWYCKVATL